MTPHLKDGPTTQQWLRRRIRLYAERAGCLTPPKVYFSMARWAQIGGNEQDWGFEGAVRALADPPKNAVYFDIKSCVCRHDADDAAAHEAVHLRWAGLRHGKTFWARKNALRAGVKFGPPGSALPSP